MQPWLPYGWTEYDFNKVTKLARFHPEKLRQFLQHGCKHLTNQMYPNFYILEVVQKHHLYPPTSVLECCWNGTYDCQVKVFKSFCFKRATASRLSYICRFALTTFEISLSSGELRFFLYSSSEDESETSRWRSTWNSFCLPSLRVDALKSQCEASTSLQEAENKELVVVPGREFADSQHKITQRHGTPPGSKENTPSGEIYYRPVNWIGILKHPHIGG